jgi:hypothetical protein
MTLNAAPPMMIASNLIPYSSRNRSKDSKVDTTFISFIVPNNIATSKLQKFNDYNILRTSK